MTKTLAFAVFACLMWTSVGRAEEFAAVRGLIVLADWQYPQSLPHRFRNHCSTEFFTGRPYCSNHCGSDYQFFFCSEDSFGCCHLGRGYCDFNGILRCSP